MKGITKLTVNVPRESVEKLREYANNHRMTMTEALRRALGLQNFVNNEAKKGTKILLEDRSGTTRQLVDA